MSGIFGLLSLFTSHPINFVQWVYYTLNCFILFVTTWCYISVRKLASQSLASNNSSAFLNQESNLTLLGVIALFVVVYILDFFTGNLFMIYLTNLWFEEEYSSTKNTSTSTTTVKSSKDVSKYLAKRVSETLSLQSASETYEVVVSLFTVILTEIVRIYFVNYSEDEGDSGRSFNVANTSNAREKADIIDRYADKINLDQFSTHRITRDKALRATVDQVLDPRTLRFLSKIFKNGTITKINGCVSTGKEANIYYAENEETSKEFAVKIYKTSILVFKDRTRYVVGEHRFGERQSKNPRQMVKNWAEKEFRNLKRLYSQPLINSPKPIELRENILVMEYLTKGKGEPSPKLRDHSFSDMNEIVHYYHEMLVLMRIMFQRCRLVHADLSEYNTIVHDSKLFVFDVSQSVEPDHPMAMDFLRMDIKNVNDFFNRIKKINVYAERDIFKFVITPDEILLKGMSTWVKTEEPTKEILTEFLSTMNLKTSDDDEFNDEVFRSLHLVSSLHNIDERDFNKFTNGDIDTLVDLVGSVKVEDETEDKSNTDDDSSDEEDEDGEDDEEDDDEIEALDASSRLKKFENKDDKKLRKQQAKEEAREKRKNKMKKHVKKKLVKKGKK
ncbi:hypothetical protein CANINC_002677 [Pichia inconspicua]|uniref:Serine/threonine-protein kinase RIO1 n=1 Tax=Pichia inconspicua TaxID=52247 RepID=A0A4T0X289_9ASCO|nr:hypothetical protein CANINC_002677 [[Candida] inconspicua]